jgi:ribonuclease-3
MDDARQASLKALEERLGYQFQERAWLDRALTHRSFSHQVDPSEKLANEVLEFLGDAVLTLAVSHLLIETHPDLREGPLSKKRAHLVKQSSLAFFAGRLQLEQHLLLGKGELQSGGPQKASLLANAFEAAIGAIYMDRGFLAALEVVDRHLRPFIRQETGLPMRADHKSLLQERTQWAHGLSPQYRVLKEAGPDHDKRFQASVLIGGEIKGVGWGKSKKLAEQEAARNALEGIPPEEILPPGLYQEGVE